MVRFINKSLKSHSYDEEEKIGSIINLSTLITFSELIAFHLRDFGGKTDSGLVQILQKTTIQLNLTSPRDLSYWMSNDNRLTKEVFLLLEIILETYVENEYLNKYVPNYITEFVEDVNDLFLIHKVPLQIRYFGTTKEFYVEKIISSEVSKKIKETLENFSDKEKVFEDFKNAIKKYSAGDYSGAIESCCVSIEDYLCILLEKKSCSSVESYYTQVSKKLKIPEDLDNRFSNLINYIHKYRSQPNHGAIEKKELSEPELTSETIIQFTMSILNYLKKKSS
jgi:hypothetical protein